MTPSPDNWYDYAASIPKDAPDTVYDSAREHYFNTRILPKALEEGFDTTAIRNDFMQRSERPDKAAFPRTELVAKEAVNALAQPFLHMAGDETGQYMIKKQVEHAREEAARQGINKPLPVIGGPYSFMGQAIGMAPYFAAGEMAAAPLLAGAETVGAGLLLKEGLEAATIGAIQGSYDAAIAPEGEKLKAFVEGGLSGAALGAAFETMRGLRGALQSEHGLTPSEAAAVENVAKGVASPEEVAQATEVVAKTTGISETIEKTTAAGIKEANKLGVPKDTKVATKEPVTKSPTAEGPRLTLKMLGADQKPYELNIPVKGMEEHFNLISDHLRSGGQLVDIQGSKKNVQKLLRQMEIVNLDERIELPVKQASPLSETKRPPATTEMITEYKPNKLVREFLEANPETTFEELQEAFDMKPAKAKQVMGWWKENRPEAAEGEVPIRAAKARGTQLSPEWYGSWVSDKGEVHSLQDADGWHAQEHASKARDLGLDDLDLLDEGWIRQRGATVEVRDLNNPHLDKALYEAFKHSDSAVLDVRGQRYLTVGKDELGEFLANPKKFAARTRYAVNPQDMPHYDQFEQLPTGEVVYKPTGEDYNNWDEANAASSKETYPKLIEGNLLGEPLPQVTGSADVPLSFRGRRQVESLAERLAAKGGLDSVQTGQSRHLRETGDALLAGNQLASHLGVDPFLDGWALGSLEGRELTRDVRRMLDEAQSEKGRHDYFLDQGEHSREQGRSYNDFAARVSRLADSLQSSDNVNSKMGLVVAPEVIEQLHAGKLHHSFTGAYEGVYRYAPNSSGEWQVRKVDINADAPLRPGTYLITPGETPYSKSARVPQSKQTPLGSRTVGSQRVLRENGAQGLAIGSNIHLSNTVDRGTLAHERYHAMTYALNLNKEVMELMEHPETEKIYGSGFSPVTRDFYGNAPEIYREEVFAHSLDAIRTNNQAKIDAFIEADTSREVFMGWFRDMAQAHLDAAATKPDSVIKRMYERSLNDASNRATRHLDDINNYFSQSEQELGLRDGNWIVDDGNTTHLFTSRESALAHMEDGEPPLNAPELVDTALLPEGVARFSRRVRPPDGKPPKTGEPVAFGLSEGPKRIEGGLQTMSFFFRPFQAWLDTVASKHNWPELYTSFSAIDSAYMNFNNFTRPYVEMLRDTLGKSPAKRQTDFYKWFETKGVEGRQRVATELQFTEPELAMLKQVEDGLLAPLAGEFGTGLDTFVHDTLPKIRAAGGVAQAFPKVGGTKYNFMIERARRGDLQVNDNLLWLTSKYLEYGAKHKFVAPSIRAARKVLLEKVEDGALRAGDLFPLLQRHLDFQTGVPDWSNRLVKNALQGAAELIDSGIKQVNSKLPASMQIPNIGKIGADPLGKFTLFQYAGTLGLKPATVFRDAMQYFITTLPIAGKYAFKGMERVFPAFKTGSEEARYLWDTARAYGALIERNDLSSLYAATEDVTTQTGAKTATNFANWSLKAIQLSHNSNRLAAFWGHTMQVEDAIKAWRLHGDLKKFSHDSGLWFLDKQMRSNLLEELPKLDNYDDFSKRAAARLVETTQWNFRRGANPGMYEHSLGRLFGQYGTWPLNYIEYARRFVAAEDKVASRAGLTRLALSHGAILAAGQSLGIDTGRWVFTAPGTDWTGGPLLQNMLNAPKLADFETEEGDEARHELRRAIMPGLIPGGVEAGRLYEAIMGDDPDAWIKVLGFHAMDNSDYNRGLHQLLPRD